MVKLLKNKILNVIYNKKKDFSCFILQSVTDFQVLNFINSFKQIYMIIYKYNLHKVMSSNTLSL